MFKGPQGNARTVQVNDPALQKKLPNLKPGQHVQFTYTEAVAALIPPRAAQVTQAQADESGRRRAAGAVASFRPGKRRMVLRQ